MQSWVPFLESPETLRAHFAINRGVSRHETLQLFYFLLPLQRLKKPTLQNKRVGVLRMAFRDFRGTGLWTYQE